MTEITAVSALEVLDSRGNPTVRVTIESNGESGTFTVPAGASTGAHEAHERRDGDARYRGNGVQDAIDAIHGEIAEVIIGFDVEDQRGLDEELRAVDGTKRLKRLGANAILGVSGAALRAAAAVQNQPLFEYVDDGADGTVPMPMVNILSGGEHAAGGMDIQDIQIIPIGANSYSTCLETVWEIRRTVRDKILERGDRPLVGDEGGFAPRFESAEDAFEFVCAGIEAAGYIPGEDVVLAVDVAATAFYDAHRAQYYLDQEVLSSNELVERILSWVERFPLVSIEDPVAEDDWDAWGSICQQAPAGVQIIGDDLIATNPGRFERVRAEGAANAVLIKPNQAGTMTRTMEVMRRAASNGFNTIVSARSGETCDSTIADLAVGLDAGQIKIGSLARSERLAKYNRLLEIERESERPFSAFNP